MRTRKKTESRRDAPLRDSLCLLALAMPVKPLANVEANYVRCDRHEKRDKVFQLRTPPSCCQIGEGQRGYYNSILHISQLASLKSMDEDHTFCPALFS